MNYKNRAENRKIRKDFLALVNLLKFKSVNLNNAQKLILLGNFILLFSLFIPWIRSSMDVLSGNINAFSKYAGNIGYVIFVFIIIMIFNLFSIQRKEKLRLYSATHIKHFPVYHILGGFSLILSVVALRFLSSLNSFSSSITTKSGAVIAIIGTVAIIVGGMFEKDKVSESKITYVNNSGNEESDNNENSEINNMKLPF